MRRRASDENGMVTVFVVTITTALILLAGLVVDGGAVLAAKRNAIDIAEQAAIAGAQGIDIDALRSGHTTALDPTMAAADANDYLSRVGVNGTVTVTGDAVTVQVTIPRRTLILGLTGMHTVDVHGQATARNARGVTTEDTP